MIAIFLHIYYPDSFPELLERFKHLLQNENYLLINFVLDTHVTLPMVPDQKNIIAIRSPNKGKDIGGKLLLINLYLSLGIESEYMIFLHDKRSPHSATGNFWKSELYKIVDPDQINTITSLFRNKKKIGIIGSKKFIRNEWDATSGNFQTTNHAILLSLIQKYRVSTTNYSFLAGTMFWVRSPIFTDFFSCHAPLAIRAGLEEGDVLDNNEGTFTHAWERMLSWIATSQGYKLYGI